MENSNEQSEEASIRPRPVFLLIIDGWGIAQNNEANAISLARTPNFSRMIKEYPTAILEAGQGSINARYLRLGSGQNLEDEKSETGDDLSILISNAGLKQVKIFESERLAAVTSYFNGRREEKLMGEEWITVSTKDGSEAFNVYKSLKGLATQSLKSIKSDKYDFIVTSLPILDTVASSANINETERAANELDKVIKKLEKEIVEHNGVMIITATHGNAERMKNMNTDMMDTEMTDNPVPFMIVGHDFEGTTLGLVDAPDGDLSLLEPAGTLADITPTVLDLLKLGKGELMSGESLLKIEKK